MPKVYFGSCCTCKSCSYWCKKIACGRASLTRSFHALQGRSTEILYLIEEQPIWCLLLDVLAGAPQCGNYLPRRKATVTWLLATCTSKV